MNPTVRSFSLIMIPYNPTFGYPSFLPFHLSFPLCSGYPSSLHVFLSFPLWSLLPSSLFCLLSFFLCPLYLPFLICLLFLSLFTYLNNAPTSLSASPNHLSINVPAFILINVAPHSIMYMIKIIIFL